MVKYTIYYLYLPEMEENPVGIALRQRRANDGGITLPFENSLSSRRLPASLESQNETLRRLEELVAQDPKLATLSRGVRRVIHNSVILKPTKSEGAAPQTFSNDPNFHRDLMCPYGLTSEGFRTGDPFYPPPGEVVPPSFGVPPPTTALPMDQTTNRASLGGVVPPSYVVPPPITTLPMGQTTYRAYPVSPKEKTVKFVEEAAGESSNTLAGPKKPVEDTTTIDDWAMIKAFVEQTTKSMENSGQETPAAENLEAIKALLDKLSKATDKTTEGEPPVQGNEATAVVDKAPPVAKKITAEESVGKSVTDEAKHIEKKNLCQHEPMAEDQAIDKTQEAEKIQETGSIPLDDEETDATMCLVPKVLTESDYSVFDPQEMYPAASCVFVANMLEQLSDDQLCHELTKIFQEYGTHWVKLRRDARNMPFAFVQFKTEDAADRAILGADGKDMFGRPLRTERARAKMTYIVYKIDGTKVTTEEVLRVFSRHGEIESATYINRATDPFFRAPPHITAVKIQYKTYDSRRDVARDRQQKIDYPEFIVREYNAPKITQEMRANPVWDHPVVRKTPEQAYLEAYDATRRSVYVANLPLGVEEEELRQYFEQAGAIVRIQIYDRARSFAFIEFKHPCNVENAIDHLNGRDFKGHVLHVTQKEFKEPQGTTPQRADTTSSRRPDSAAFHHRGGIIQGRRDTFYGGGTVPLVTRGRSYPNMPAAYHHGPQQPAYPTSGYNDRMYSYGAPPGMMSNQYSAPSVEMPSFPDHHHHRHMNYGGYHRSGQNRTFPRATAEVFVPANTASVASSSAMARSGN